ncbi:hypothetical protein A2U01_0072047, partial [Trifolium medium]|nr:hypothetical protein [Trifolium medium]
FGLDVVGGGIELLRSELGLAERGLGVAERGLAIGELRLLPLETSEVCGCGSETSDEEGIESKIGSAL